MKKVLIFLPLFLYSLAAFSQEPARFSWGVSLYPNFSDRRLIAFSNISEEMIRALDSREISKPSWSAGLFGGWKGYRVGFQFGVQFMDIGYRTVKEPFPANEPNPTFATERRYVYQNYNIETPVEILFIQELRPGAKFHFMLGGSLSYNLRNNIRIINFAGDSKEVTVSQEDQDLFRDINYAFQTGIGFEKNFGERLSVFFQPTFQFWIKGILKDNELNRNLYSFGLKTGVRFN